MYSVGTELSQQLADAVEHAGTSIVRIAARPHLTASGIVWADGIVVAASHTIHHDEGIRVNDTEATLAGRDPATDIAVLRCAAATTPIAWSDAQPRPGEIVIAAAELDPLVGEILLHKTRKGRGFLEVGPGFRIALERGVVPLARLAVRQVRCTRRLDVRQVRWTLPHNERHGGHIVAASGSGGAASWTKVAVWHGSSAAE